MKYLPFIAIIVLGVATACSTKNDPGEPPRGRETRLRFRCDSAQFMGYQSAQQAGVVGQTSRRHRLTRLRAAIAQGFGDMQAAH